MLEANDKDSTVSEVIQNLMKNAKTYIARHGDKIIQNVIHGLSMINLEKVSRLNYHKQETR